LNQASSRSGSPPEPSCAWAGSFAVRFRMLAENQLLGTERGRNPASKPDRKACVQSQSEGSFVKNARAIFPLPDDGLPAWAQF